MSKIYFDLDTILDTRFSTLSKHHPQIAEKALKGNYRERIIDAFEGLPRKEFIKLYQQRDEEILASSLKTNIFAIMHGIARDQIIQNGHGADFDELTYVVNIYPYDLSDKEKQYLIRAIEVSSLDTYPVELVSISDKELTPTHCRENYVMMVRYLFGEWVDLHKDEFLQKPMPGVTLIAPALLEEIPDFEELKRRGDMHPFQAIEMALAPIFCLRLMEPSLFSIIDGIKVRETSPEPTVPP